MAAQAPGEEEDQRAQAHQAVVRLGVAAIFVAVLGALVLTAQLWLWLFAAVLFAIFLRGMSDALARRTPLGEGASYALVTVTFLATVAGGIWLVAPSVAEQVDALAGQISGWLAEMQDRLRETTWGRRLMEQVAEGEAGGDLMRNLGGVVTGSTNVLLQLLVVFVTGLYIGASPRMYVSGLVRLAPIPRRPRTEEVLRAVGATLRAYLLGRVVSMLAVGTLTSLGLWALDVPLAATLGIIAGLLTFVPYAGPIAASFPIGVVALMEGGSTFLIAIGYYTVVQMIEGFFITPLVQQRVVALPPAMTLAAEVFMGMLFGAFGVVISVPLAAALLVVVRMVYVGGVLGEERAPATEEG